VNRVVMVAYPIPLRPGVIAEARLPPDLTVAEADKLCTAIHALVLEPAEEDET